MTEVTKNILILNVKKILEIEINFTAQSFWCIKWQLTISIKNIYIFNAGKMHQEDLFINAVCLPLVNTVKDLGIIIDSPLKLD